jgi:hypothetical protein
MVTFPIPPRPLSNIASLFQSLLLVLFAGHASAEQPFSFATTPGQLPKTVMPVHYALDPVLARETLAIALTDELPTSLLYTLISRVAGEGEQPDLAWSFVQANFDALVTRQGSSSRNYFASSLMTNFTDAGHAAELARFAPVNETSGGRLVADRAQERIMTDADFSARLLPAVDDWVRGRTAR